MINRIQFSQQIRGCFYYRGLSFPDKLWIYVVSVDLFYVCCFGFFGEEVVVRWWTQAAGREIQSNSFVLQCVSEASLNERLYIFLILKCVFVFFNVVSCWMVEEGNRIIFLFSLLSEWFFFPKLNVIIAAWEIDF